MKFYKVQEEKNYWDKYGNWLGTAIQDELITEKEMEKRKYPKTSNFVPVEVKKTQTYWFFGCRFEVEK